MSYILVPLCFAALGMIYWVTINRIYDLASVEDEPKAIAQLPQATNTTLTTTPAPTRERDVAHKAPIYEPPPKAPTAETPKISPRLGTGPDAYKDIPDLQLVQWAMEESVQVEQMANSTLEEMETIPSLSRVDRIRFNQDFKDCCVQDIKGLRAEILRRLGPLGRDLDEISRWTLLFPDTKYEAVASAGWPPPISPFDVRDYAPYLRKLALRLKRQSIPRAAPRNLDFKEELMQGDTALPFVNVVTIHISTKIDSGYLVLECKTLFARAGTDFAGSTPLPDLRLIDNQQFKDYYKELRVNSAQRGFYELRIGTVPMTPDRPIHVVLRSLDGYARVDKVTLFDE